MAVCCTKRLDCQESNFAMQSTRYSKAYSFFIKLLQVATHSSSDHVLTNNTFSINCKHFGAGRSREGEKRFHGTAAQR